MQNANTSEGTDLSPGRVHQVLSSTYTSRMQRIKDKAQKYRCTLSSRLMKRPVMALDGNYYEQSIVAGHPSFLKAIYHPKLKAKIIQFSKKSLETLGVCPKLYLAEDTLDLTAEFLSVLDLEAEVETVLRVIKATDQQFLTKLTWKLKDLVSDEYLFTLLNRLTEQSKAVCLARALLIEPRSDFEEAFTCFTGMLSQVSLSVEAIELAEEVSGRLSCSQLSRMNLALRAYPRQEEVATRLDRLRLKEAYIRLEEGDADTARAIVSSLYSLEEEVLEFCEEAGWHTDKLLILKHKLSTSLEVLSQESPYIAAALQTIQQLFYVELQVARAADQVTLRSEVAALNESKARRVEESARAKEQQRSLSSEYKLQRLEECNRRTMEANRALKAEAEAFIRDIVQLHGEIYRLDKAVAQLQTTQQLKTDALHQGLMQTGQHAGGVSAKAYSYESNTKKLHWTDLASEEQMCVEVPYVFKLNCYLSELPGGSLLITGGGNPSTREVVRLDVRSLTVVPLAHMITPRRGHAAVYFDNYLYVLGGRDEHFLKSCERYACRKGRWKALMPLPKAGRGMSGVVVERSLYALGGYEDHYLDSIQKLSLESLSWELLPLRLPCKGRYIPCFQSGNQVYFIMDKTLYSFLPIKPLKTLPAKIFSWRAASHYTNGTLYCSYGDGAVGSWKIGDLR
jgi:hypothetical protein